MDQITKTIDQKLDEGRQYRSIDVTNFEIRSDDEDMVVSGYATTFNQPYELFSYDGYTVMEQLSATAFDECDMSDVIMQFDHQGRVFARTSNNTLTLTPDDYGLAVRAKLGGTELGRQLYEDIDGGYITKMSFGFRVEEDERTQTQNHETGEITILRTITKIGKLYDVSAVSLPANDATSISARSFGEGVIEEVKQELLEREKRERQKRRIQILTEGVL